MSTRNQPINIKTILPSQEPQTGFTEITEKRWGKETIILLACRSKARLIGFCTFYCTDSCIYLIRQVEALVRSTISSPTKQRRTDSGFSGCCPELLAFLGACSACMRSALNLLVCVCLDEADQPIYSASSNSPKMHGSSCVLKTNPMHHTLRRNCSSWRKLE